MYNIKQASIRDAESISNIIRFANIETDLNKNIKYKITFDDITSYYVQNSMSKGDLYFLISYQENYIGVISLSKLNSRKPIIRRLAILPKYQKKGLGNILIKHIEDIALNLNKTKITLGVREDKPNLINWYKKIGYNVGSSRSFKKYPFKIIFMYKDL